MFSIRTLIPALAIALLAGFSHTTAFAGAETGGKAPDFVLPDADGNLVSLKDYRGKALVVHFWASWCPYCKKVQPGLQALADDYTDRGLVVIGISFREDPGTEPQKILKARGHRFITLVDGDEVAEMYGVRGTPTTVFINAKGTVVGSTHTSDPADPILERLADQTLAGAD